MALGCSHKNNLPSSAGYCSSFISGWVWIHSADDNYDNTQYGRIYRSEIHMVTVSDIEVPRHWYFVYNSSICFTNMSEQPVGDAKYMAVHGACITQCVPFLLALYVLFIYTYWGRDKMNAGLLTTYSTVLSEMKSIAFWFKFPLSLFP